MESDGRRKSLYLIYRRFRMLFVAQIGLSCCAGMLHALKLKVLPVSLLGLGALEGICG